MVGFLQCSHWKSDRVDDNGLACHKAFEVMILDSNVLGPWSELRGLDNCNATVAILPNCVLEYWHSENQSKSTTAVEIFFKRPIKGITSLIAVDKVMYSLSVVQSAISV